MNIHLILLLSNAVISLHMSYIKILVHCVWTTKGRVHFLKDNIKGRVIAHICENAISKEILIDCMNGFSDHLHAIVSLRGTQSISGVMHYIKGESSYWMNKNRITKMRFEWQDDFYAVSIGMDHFDNLRGYIKNQEEHHRKVPIQDELDLLIKEYQMERIRD